MASSLLRVCISCTIPLWLWCWSQW